MTIPDFLAQLVSSLKRFRGGGGLFVSSRVSNQVAAAALLSMEGSENAKHLVEALVNRPPNSGDSYRGYGPHGLVHWIETIRLEQAISVADIRAAWVPERAKECGRPTLYGRLEQSGQLTDVRASEAQGAFTELVLGWDFVRYDADAPLTEASVQCALEHVAIWAGSLPGSHLELENVPERVASRSRDLFALKQQADLTVTVVAKAPDGAPYTGRDVWDVLLSAGLEWGDMDMFHLANPNRDGDDFWFSVETSTAPGYFFPEDVQSGKMNAEDLVFSFSVPRNTAPVHTVKTALLVANYVTERLGGHVTNAQGGQFDRDGEIACVKAVVKQLRSLGFESGTSATLLLF